MVFAVASLVLLTGACAPTSGETEVSGGPVRSRDADDGSKDTASRAPVTEPAPHFEVTTFDGRTFSLAEQRGTPVVLNFWESW